jgi:hypothetical protein
MDWKEVGFAGTFRFSVPADVVEITAHGIDSDVAHWEGGGITVRVDSGLFSDPLTSYANHPGTLDDVICGRPARLVSFDRDDGSRFAAAHFLEKTGEPAGRGTITVVVETDRGVEPEVGAEILRSIEFKGGP